MTEYIYEVDAGVVKRHRIVEKHEDVVTASAGPRKGHFTTSLGHSWYKLTPEEAIKEDFDRQQEELQEAFQELEDNKATYAALLASTPTTLEEYKAKVTYDYKA